MTSTIIGIPKEIKTDEKRVSLTPSAVEQIVGNGNQVFVQSTAGEGAGFDNSQYEKAGAKILDTAEEVFKESKHCYFLQNNLGGGSPPALHEKYKFPPGTTSVSPGIVRKYRFEYNAEIIEYLYL